MERVITRAVSRAKQTSQQAVEPAIARIIE